MKPPRVMVWARWDKAGKLIAAQFEAQEPEPILVGEVVHGDHAPIIVPIKRGVQGELI